MIIQRQLLNTLLNRLTTDEIVLVEGPPRSGRSTLAGQVLRAVGSTALMLEPHTPARLALARAPESLLESSAGLGRLLGSGRVLVADDARPEEARALVAALSAAPSPAAGRTRFVLIGTSFGKLPGTPLRLELGPLSLDEVGVGHRVQHWLRGGFPEAFFAPNDRDAFSWLGRYAAALAEERFAQAGLPWAPGRTRALLGMAAAAQGQAFNENAAARSLDVSRPTIARSLTALEAAGILRFLPSLASPAGKRRLRSPALYLRDSGLFHCLSGIGSPDGLLASRLLAISWTGYAIELSCRGLPPGLEAARYGLPEGSGLDLVLHRQKRPIGAAVFRIGRGVAPSRGLEQLRLELGLERVWIVLPEAEEREADRPGFSEIGLRKFQEMLAGRRDRETD